MEGVPDAGASVQTTAAPSPYLGVFDEYGYYAVKGFAVVPAQARSLGFSICFGGQDIQSFGKESQEEAAAIVANTLTKIGMFVEDPKDTMELFEKLGGQALAVQSSGLSKSDGVLLSGFYRDAASATYERRARIDPLDLRAQATGEAHILRGIAIVRARLFYPGAFRMAAYRLNRFVPVNTTDAPDADDPALIAPTPEGVRAALARVLAEAPLDALQMGALRAVVEADETAAKPDARTSGRQTFAKRLIERYLDHHDALDAEFAARLREAGGHPAVTAGGETEGAVAGDAGVARGTANVPDALRAAVRAVLNGMDRPEASEPGRPVRPRDVGRCYRGGMVAHYEPEGDTPPPAADEPPLHHSDERAASRSIEARHREGRLPVVAVDRLEDLDGPGASAFRADAWAVHPEREPEQ